MRRLSHSSFLLALLAVATPALLWADGVKSFKGRVSAESYRNHVAYLASDELGGRGIGEPGIDLAAEYIAKEFKDAGLEPGGADGFYFQPFDLKMWKRIGEKTNLAANAGDKRLAFKIGEDFTPMPWSDSGELKGGVAFVGYGIDHGENGYDDYAGIDVKGKIVVMLRYEPLFLLDDPAKPEEHSRHAQFRLKAERATDREAAAVIVVDPDHGKGEDKLCEFGRGGGGNYGVPMLHLTRAAASRLLAAGGLADVATLQKQIESTKKPASAELKGVEIRGEVELASAGPNVKNVLGILRGSGPHADEFVVVGGHHDHLGNSTPMFRPNEPKQIHNGADDNASGTSAVIEAARLLASGPKPGRSILFMTFSAEESGLLGSRHWVNHPTIPLKQVVAMINMDMVGRLRKNMLEVGGMRTGEGFEKMVHQLGKEYGFDIHDGGGGRGPSDHASFYGKNVPVLFLFTGLHKQYHKPDDDIDLINAEGAAHIAEMAADMALEIAARPERPKFSKDSRPEPLLNPDNPDSGRPRSPRRERRGVVTAADRKLGIYADAKDAEKRGVLLADVNETQAAAKAGLRAGDRILAIDETEVKSAADIRGLLEKSSSDSVSVRYEREGKVETVTVPFIPSKPAGSPTPRAHGDDAEQQREMPRVRLGIMPSYGESDGKDGYAFEGVVPGGTAAKAGIKDGDRILSIGGRKCSDIGTYMSALSKFKHGDETVIVVLRDGKPLEFKVKLEGSRPRGNE